MCGGGVVLWLQGQALALSCEPLGFCSDSTRTATIKRKEQEMQVILVILFV